MGHHALRTSRIAFLCFTVVLLGVILNELRISSGSPNIEVFLNAADTLHNSGLHIQRRGTFLERSNASLSKKPSKRALTFDEAVAKGSGYLCRLTTAAPGEGVTTFPPQSQFVDFADLQDNGWSSAPYPLARHDSVPELQPALTFLFPANNPGNINARNDQHNLNYANSEGQNTLVSIKFVLVSVNEDT